MINNNVIHAAYKHKVKKLLFLGSSCIYPKLATQPIKESELLNGYLEPTNEAYAIAKISGLKMCEYYRRQYGCDFISAMPCNMYGINDNFDLETSHLLPALIRKMHEAKINNSPECVLLGTGKPFREFLFSDDLADALLFLMNNYSDFEHVNIGSGIDQTILDTAILVKSVVGFQGKIVHDLTKPDGMFRKVLDITKIKNLGWQPKTSLVEGVKQVYDWYLNK
jgi:GDP-L-fucose synthase